MKWLRKAIYNTVAYSCNDLGDTPNGPVLGVLQEGYSQDDAKAFTPLEIGYSAKLAGSSVCFVPL